MPQKSTLPRRKFLKNSLLTAAGAALGAAALQSCANHKLTLKAAPQQLLQTDPIPIVKVGFVGVGHQGTSHVRNFLNIDGVEIKAFCDIRPERVEAVQKMIVEAGKSKPAGYS
ncbi:MAG: twin-arginine translocation signal domain-containing protein, partial [Caldisericaceae bacterium]|nr:twin-arginine translocation signal domain-containing protein [Caldisericaceae bacterium]